MPNSYDIAAHTLTKQSVYSAGYEYKGGTFSKLFRPPKTGDEIAKDLGKFAGRIATAAEDAGVVSFVRALPGQYKVQVLFLSPEAGTDCDAIFQEVVKDFDLTSTREEDTAEFAEFRQISFRKNRCIFDDVLKRRFDFPHLFTHLPIPTAHNFLKALIEEESRYESNRLSYQLQLDIFTAALESGDSKTLAPEFLQYLNKTDDIRLELFGIGGAACTALYELITSNRAQVIAAHIKMYTMAFGEEGAVSIRTLQNTYDAFFADVTKNPLMTRVPFIDTNETLAYALTLPDDEFLAISKSLSSDDFIDYLVNAGVLHGLTSEQMDELTIKLSLLGTAADEPIQGDNT